MSRDAECERLVDMPIGIGQVDLDVVDGRTRGQRNQLAAGTLCSASAGGVQGRKRGISRGTWRQYVR